MLTLGTICFQGSTGKLAQWQVPETLPEAVQTQRRHRAPSLFSSGVDHILWRSPRSLGGGSHAVKTAISRQPCWGLQTAFVKDFQGQELLNPNLKQTV